MLRQDGVAIHLHQARSGRTHQFFRNLNKTNRTYRMAHSQLL